MTLFLMLDETNHEGCFLRKTLVNLNDVIRLVPNGPNHCSMLLRSFTIGPYQATLSNLHLSSSLLFVAGSLQELQVKLNIVGSN